MEFVCGYCGETKDEMVFLPSHRAPGRTKPRKCKECSRRGYVIHFAELRNRKLKVADNYAEVMAILYKTVPFLDVLVRRKIALYALEKKWTIEAVMNLHEIPKPLIPLSAATISQE
jgi:hypothetical protein